MKNMIFAIFFKEDYNKRWKKNLKIIGSLLSHFMSLVCMFSMSFVVKENFHILQPHIHKLLLRGHTQYNENM